MGEFPDEPTRRFATDNRDEGGVALMSVTGDHSSPRRFLCPIAGCGKTFRRRFACKEHVASHTGLKPYVCTVDSCGRCFTTSGNLARHTRSQHPWLHTPLACLVDDCTCTFQSIAKLERHIAMVHFDPASHICVVRGCGRAFASAGNLRRHVRQRHEATAPSAKHVRRAPSEMRSPTAVDEPINESTPLTLTEAVASDVDLWREVARLFE